MNDIQTAPSKPKTVAIIGAGASGLMVGDVLSHYNVRVEVYEQLPSAGRKILWAGKTGLNITHAEPMEVFITRYTPSDWLAPVLWRYDNRWLRRWFDELGVATFVGSSGRVFPNGMKASKFLRLWLARLMACEVAFYYRHECVGIDGNCLTLRRGDEMFTKRFDAVVLACGGGSYAKLGATGAWQAWLGDDEKTPLYASNVGVERAWSAYMSEHFGKPLKRVALWIDSVPPAKGDVIITHYGLESSLIYQYNQPMRQGWDGTGVDIYMDLLPDKTLDDVKRYFIKKQSLNNILRKMGLDDTKIALVRECTPKADWTAHDKMANYIKKLPIRLTGFRPMDEAISTGGGVKRSSLSDELQLRSNPYVFCCGEMLDFDAPTGGYLLTACFTTGQVVGHGVVKFLGLMNKISPTSKP